MILLTSTSDKLQLITSAAAAVDVHASWIDNSASAITPGRTNTAVTTATTTDIVAAPAASVQRNIKTLHVHNSDGALSCDVTVQHTDGTNIVQLHKVTLANGDGLEYIDEVGFRVIGKTLITTGGGGITVGTTPITGGTSTQVLYDLGGVVQESPNLTISSGQPQVSAGNAYLYDGVPVIAAQSSLNNYYFGGAGNFTATGSSNISIGVSSGASLTSGANNMLIGGGAGAAITTGAANACIGINSGARITTGGSNVCIGTSSGPYLVIGSSNVSIGASSMASGGDVGAIVAIGTSVLNVVTGGNNTAVGYAAGSFNTSGTYNTYVGSSCAPPSLTTGSNNTLIGAQMNNAATSLGSTNPSRLTAMSDGTGALSMWVDSGGPTYSVALGVSAGNYASVTGVYNTTIGKSTGGALTSGAGNTIVGTNVGLAVTSGNNNTFIGTNSTPTGAGGSVTTGSNNVIIGAYAGSATLASNVILADGAGNIRFQHDGTDVFIANSAAFAIRFKTVLTNAAAANTATLTNAPVTGNPTKWLSIDDGGTTRRIPAW